MLRPTARERRRVEDHQIERRQVTAKKREHVVADEVPRLGS